MGSSKKWTAIISSISSSLYFCFIVFQIPLFSYLSVTGALLGGRRMSIIRTLLLLWGLPREAIMFRFACDKALRKAVYIDPNMPIFVLCAFLSIRKDLRKIICCCKAKHIKNYL
ncbi:hypothetical protein CUMW_198870 [Citrus unshiu]|nr:hypothetical protein CUMW_198870 [Citrus unshiu]